jgi:hypothetical protein
MKKLLDLRFVIGFFFLLVGICLFAGSFVMQPDAGKSESVNRWCGLAYVLFAAIMLVLWRLGRNRSSDPES